VDYLLEFGSREDVRDLARDYLRRSEAVQGISADLDDFWLASWQLYTLLSRDDFRRAEELLFARVMHGMPWPLIGSTFAGWRGSLAETFNSYPFGIDTTWRPSWWSDYISVRGVREEPYTLTVVLRPEAPPGSLYDLREIDSRGFQVRFEARPLARLYATATDAVRPLVGGISLSNPSGPPGTLGGIIEDSHGQRFGLTCAHVLASGDEAQQPSPRDNAGAATRVGRCIAASPLTTHTPPLDPYDPSINELDVGLVELDQPADLEVLHLGALAGIAAKSRVHPNGSVDVVGKESGRQSVYMGGVTLTHEFDLHGVKYGYKNLFELKRRSRFYGITGTIRPPVRPGDSGGWVITAGATGSEWLGVVVAGDGPVGYATPAEFLTDWLAQNTAISRPSVT
jgi:hypothetical protein